jgi:hypothetical protein
VSEGGSCTALVYVETRSVWEKARVPLRPQCRGMVVDREMTQWLIHARRSRS